jgi:hypothetical protein
MTPNTEPSERDMELLVDYVDGRLDAAERDALELRLSQDPELEEALESFLRVDRLQRLAAEQASTVGGAPRGRLLTFPRALAALAAAALIVVGGPAVVRWIEGPARIGFRVAALPSGVTLADHNRCLELDPTLHPPGNGLRSGAAGTEIPVGEYMERVAAAEASRIEQGLAAKDELIETSFPYYVVPIEVAAPASAVVVQLDEQGGRARVFPTGDDATHAAGRLAAGRHVLPSPTVRLTPESEAYDAVDFARGFQIPRDAGVVTVLVALRAEALAPELLAELDALLSGGADVVAVEEWLDAQGFARRALRLREVD